MDREKLNRKDYGEGKKKTEQNGEGRTKVVGKF